MKTRKQIDKHFFRAGGDGHRPVSAFEALTGEEVVDLLEFCGVVGGEKTTREDITASLTVGDGRDSPHMEGRLAHRVGVLEAKLSDVTGERDQAIDELNNTLAERDRASKERDKAIAECDKANQHRCVMVEERNEGKDQLAIHEVREAGGADDLGAENKRFRDFVFDLADEPYQDADPNDALGRIFAVARKLRDEVANGTEILADKEQVMFLYRVVFDGQPDYVEAPSFAEAIVLWREHLIKNNNPGDIELDVQPESVELIHEEAVIRQATDG